jgi:hypothetical protein
VLAREAIGPGLVSGDTVGGVLMVQLPAADSSIYEPNGNGIYDVLPGLDRFTLEHFDFRVLGYEEEVYGDSVVISNLCADLVAVDVTVDLFDPSARPGDEVPITAALLNDSTVRVAEGGVARVLLSRDTVIDVAEDRVLGELTLPLLEPHTTYELLGEPVVLPGLEDAIWVSGDHTYYVGLMVDPPVGLTDCDPSNNTSLGTAVSPLKVNVALYSAGDGVRDGAGTEASPYVALINRSVGPVNADPGAGVYFGFESVPAGGLLDFEFSAPEGTGTLYISVNGGLPTIEHHDYAVAYVPGSNLDVVLQSGSGSVDVLLIADGGLSGGELRLESAVKGPPLVSVLTPSDMSTMSTNYGGRVAVSGDVVAVGDWRDSSAGSNAGIVYVFRWNGETWIESKVVPENHLEWQGFGYALGLDGDTLVVTSKWTGYAHAFEWDGLTWTEQAVLHPQIIAEAGSVERADVTVGPFASVALDGSRVLLGSPEFYYRSWDTLVGAVRGGAAFLYEHDGSSWVEDAHYFHQGISGVNFSKSVSISGDILAISDPENTGSQPNWNGFNGNFIGAVWLYRWDGNAWQESLFGQWEYPDVDYSSGFGTSVSAQGDRVAIGAPGRYTHFAGVVHLRDWDGSGWMPSRVSPSDSVGEDLFGLEVSLRGGRLAVSSGRGVYLFASGQDGWEEVLWHGVDVVPTPWRQYHPALSEDGGLLAIGEADDRVIKFVGGVTNVAPPATVTVYNLRDGFGARESDALLARYFTESEITADRSLIQKGDPDGDGQSTFMELVVGTDPLIAGSVKEPMTWREEAGELVFDIHRHIDASAIQMVLMTSANLVDWVQAGAQPALESADPGSGEQLWRVRVPVESAGVVRAYRLLVRD